MQGENVRIVLKHQRFFDPCPQVCGQAPHTLPGSHFVPAYQDTPEPSTGVSAGSATPSKIKISCGRKAAQTRKSSAPSARTHPRRTRCAEGTPWVLGKREWIFSKPRYNSSTYSLQQEGRRASANARRLTRRGRSCIRRVTSRGCRGIFDAS